MSQNSTPYHDDNWTIEDFLYFSDFQPALIETILKSRTPLTIGVFGPWGSGKTSLLKMIQNEIQRKVNPLEIRTVWFTAWKYGRHEDLWKAFILSVIEALRPKDANGEPLELDEIKDGEQRQEEVQLLRLIDSLYETVTWEEMGNWRLDIGQTLKETIKLPPSLLLHLAGQAELAKDFGINPNFADIIKRVLSLICLDGLRYPVK